ncbi:unnamed protein product, partial [Rotaria sp. Silwood1]
TTNRSETPSQGPANLPGPPPKGPTHPSVTQSPSDPSKVENHRSKQIEQLQMDLIRKMDNDIRQLLQYYKIDDRDIVVVNDGPIHRLLMRHPKLTSPVNIQQAENSLRQLENEKEVNPQQSKEKLTREEQQQLILTQAEERKIIDAVIEQLLPLFKQLVSTTAQRILMGGNTQDNGYGVIPFPSMFNGSGPMFVSSHEYPLPQVFQQQPEQPIVTVMESNLGGNPGHPASVSSDYFMPLMNDILGGSVQSEINAYLTNVPSPPQIPALCHKICQRLYDLQQRQPNDWWLAL